MPLFLFGINKIAVSMSNVSKIGTPYLIKSKSINDDYQMREIGKFFPRKKKPNLLMRPKFSDHARLADKSTIKNE